MAAGHLALGRLGEDAAAAYLSRRGYAILARNWRPSGRAAGLELDIVCRKGKDVVFVEVKTRGPGSLCDPCEVLTPAKASRLLKAAGHWLSANDCWDARCRFDFIAVAAGADLKNPAMARVKHYTDVIDAGHALRGGDAAWQPF